MIRYGICQAADVKWVKGVGDVYRQGKRKKKGGSDHVFGILGKKRHHLLLQIFGHLSRDQLHFGCEVSGLGPRCISENVRVFVGVEERESERVNWSDLLRCFNMIFPECDLESCR